MSAGPGSGLTPGVAAAMREASARAILPRWQSLAADEIIAKAADDVVTVADHESEAILSERLAALLPDAMIVGEEAAHADPAVLDRLATGLCWVIDPLDGTRNFAAGRSPFGVLVALADNGRTIGGWIYDPLRNRLCHAELGGGAYVGEERITARTTGENPPVAAISLLFADLAAREALVTHVTPHYRLVDIPLCAAEQYPRIALGENDVSFFSRTLPWDHAAGALWLNEAGGKAARLDGRLYQAGEWDEPRMIGAASPALWDAFATHMAGLI